jgi:hypothetical protein
MPRGKNYVNNNNGVFLQASAKAKQSMKFCEYGSACNRPDCIYRHDSNAESKTEEVCLPYLAGKCSFTASGGCRKRHPKKEERDRLLQKYKRTRCRFGDECFTESCLYLHPHEMEVTEPHYIEPHELAFPPLNGAASPPSATKQQPANSPWKKVVPPEMSPPVPMQPPQAAWYPSLSPQDPMRYPYYVPSNSYGHEGNIQIGPASANFTPNADAKEFIPGAMQ